MAVNLARDIRESEPSAAIRATRERRLELGAVLADVERAISAPGPMRPAEWARNTSGQLKRLREAFVRHIDATEGPAGLHDEILEAAPRLRGMVDRLQEEHLQIREGISRELTVVNELPRVVTNGGKEKAGSVDRARRVILMLLARIARHRQHGADLIYEAFEVDIGGG